MARTLVLAVMLGLAACSADAPDEIIIAGATMGTQYTVKLLSGTHTASDLRPTIEERLEYVDTTYSTYRADSVVSQFNGSSSTDWFPVSTAVCASIREALELSELTGGAFDITVAPLVNLWGFGPGEMIDEPPDAAEVAALLETVGYRHLHTDCDMPALRKDIPELQLDMSACGKGLAVDEIAELLDAAHVKNYAVEVGGELRLRGHNAKGEYWAIGIERPITSERRPHTVVHLTDAALATSGDYRNYFEAGGQRFSHTIDTRTGKPVTHTLASVTVIDDSGYRADALATALLVLGPQNGMALAVRENLAAMFLSRGEAGIDEVASPAFEELRKT